MNKKYTYLIIIFLIVVSFAAFGRIAGNDFINFDDPATLPKIITFSRELISRTFNGHLQPFLRTGIL